MDVPSHLSPSTLGTKEYWENAYSTELANHASNPEDEGTIWFADSGAEERILDFLETLETSTSNGTEFNVDNPELRILDLGTGNGHLLFALRDEGWIAQMVGVDYSTRSVELAKQIQVSRSSDRAEDDSEVSSQESGIVFEQWDILKESPGDWLRSGFDIILDKGTFDAISLSDEVLDDGRRPCETYSSRVAPLLKPGGHLLVTSCNWTEAELRKWFEGQSLQYHDSVQFPSFTFGGVQGQTVSSVCFQKRRQDP